MIRIEPPTGGQVQKDSLAIEGWVVTEKTGINNEEGEHTMIKIAPVHRKQPEQRIGSMSASDADQLLRTYTYHTEDPDSPNQKGYQRPPDETRFPQIAADIDQYGATPIILSDRGRWQTLFSGPNRPLEMTVDEVIEALASGGVEPDRVFLSVIDGQHRTEAALRLFRRGIDVELPFLIYLDLSWPDEVERFNTINTKAKNLPRALVEVNRQRTFSREGATSRQIQEQDVRDVILALETEKDSIWHGEINMTGGRNTGRPVTFEGLRRSTMATFTGPLALLDVPTKVEMAKAYWKVISETWPDAWNEVPQMVEVVDPETNEVVPREIPVKYRIKDLAGVSALAKLGGAILVEAYDQEAGKLNTAVVRDRLARAKDVSWVKSPENPDMNAQAGFSGLADMYDMLLNRVYGKSAVA